MFIFSNLAISLDGKIATKNRSFFPLGTPEDRKQMMVLRKKCDALLMGAETLRVYRKPCLITKSPWQPLNIIVSSRLDHLSPEWEFFKSSRIERILFVGHSALPSRISKFAKSSEIVVLQAPTSRNPLALQIQNNLARRSIKRLLVEGGGGMMWNFISQGLIDEFHVTLTPKILGGSESPTLVDGEGFLPQEITHLKLKQCRIVGDELYLIYARKTQRKR